MDTIEKRGRPKLVKFNIKKNSRKWTLKDLDNNKTYYMLVNQSNAEYRLNNFLQKVNAKDDIHPKSKNPMDFANLVQDIMNKGKKDIWIPANKIKDVKGTYVTESKEEADKHCSEFKTFREFLNERKQNKCLFF